MLLLINMQDIVGKNKSKFSMFVVDLIIKLLYTHNYKWWKETLDGIYL
jgi:hypothetical protein